MRNQKPTIEKADVNLLNDRTIRPSQLFQFQTPQTWVSLLAADPCEAMWLYIIMCAEEVTGAGYLRWCKKTYTWNLTEKGKHFVWSCS